MVAQSESGIAIPSLREFLRRILTVLARHDEAQEFLLAGGWWSLHSYPSTIWLHFSLTGIGVKYSVVEVFGASSLYLGDVDHGIEVGITGRLEDLRAQAGLQSWSAAMPEDAPTTS